MSIRSLAHQRQKDYLNLATLSKVTTKRGQHGWCHRWAPRWVEALCVLRAGILKAVVSGLSLDFQPGENGPDGVRPNVPTLKRWLEEHLAPFEGSLEQGAHYALDLFEQALRNAAEPTS